VTGTAARAEVTPFDEPYAGLDPVARQLFYDRLLADYAEHPRTVLLSTHLIDEAAGLFERVMVLAGPWYLSRLTSFVALALMLAWGMWFGIVYRRWNLAGLLSFLAAQALALLLVLLAIGGAHDWHSVAHFFTTLTIGALTGLLAVLTVVLLAGGYATMRRVTV
jgi:hypothetical protein